MASDGQLEARPLDPTLAEALVGFLESLDDEDRKFFHPHGSTRADVQALCSREGKDQYRVFVEDGRILVYGLLRGWDEGYEVPSIGVAVHRDARGRGLASRMMESMHDVAYAAGAKQVRARVHADNKASRRMCESLGYVFGGEDRGQALGLLDLQTRAERQR